VQGLVEHSIYPKAGRVETWAFRVGLAAAIVGILCGQLPDRWLPVSVVLQVVVACLSIQIGGFLLGGVLAARAVDDVGGAGPRTVGTRPTSP
jgi:hypothetical protein